MIEQDVVVAFTAAGISMDDEQAANETSSCVHGQVFSFYSFRGVM